MKWGYFLVDIAQNGIRERDTHNTASGKILILHLMGTLFGGMFMGHP
jgi:hypothetical protein